MWSSASQKLFSSNEVETLKKSAVALDLRDPDYTKIEQAIGEAPVVLIGEASHGTHEFYEQRAEITKRLIQNKGFTMIAVEADWPDAYRVNRYVQKGKHSRDKSADDALQDFKRFPLWMWRNTVVRDFVEWLSQFNDNKEKKERIAFYGMDLYSFYSSMDAVVEYLEKVAPEDAKKARKNYSNFDRFQGEPSAYGYAAGLGLIRPLERDVVKTLVDLREKEEEYLKGVGGLIDGDELFYAQQNAQLVKNAEEYYRQMYAADERTWNIRDKHMADCVSSLVEFHTSKFPDKKQKVVIWAHNSHIGDASKTDAGRKRGEWNIGQLLRERFGLNQTFNIGFNTYTGSVTAATEWDRPAQFKHVNPGMANSNELLFHKVAESMDQKNFLLINRSNSDQVKTDSLAVNILSQPRYERYIGVIYRPDTEKASHYTNASIGQEFDSVIFMDETNAVEPLDYTKTWTPEHATQRVLSK